MDNILQWRGFFCLYENERMQNLANDKGFIMWNSSK